MKHLNTEQLEEGLNQIFQSPKDEGQLALIVCIKGMANMCNKLPVHFAVSVVLLPSHSTSIN